MPRKTGYLANVLAVPPLIFRFQFNPTMLSEKKSYKYEDEGRDRDWAAFPEIQETWGGIDGWEWLASPFTLGYALYQDIKAYGPLLSNVKPLKAQRGQPRVLALEFQLLAGTLVEGLGTLEEPPATPFPFEDAALAAGPRFEDQVYRRNVLEPDLAILRSFVNPGWELTEVADIFGSGSERKAAWNAPPECLFKYGDFSLTCVVSDLNIKLSEFGEDALPQKADVSMTLKEQSLSTDTTVDTVMRMVQSIKGLTRLEGEDWLAVTPIAGSFVSAGSLLMDV
ncbi:MAG: hypothetical protein HKN04_09435 [Rhodothermaceae bacterium]|nr:hypothetical protein [Rhodothermaceae bacterium]